MQLNGVALKNYQHEAVEQFSKFLRLCQEEGLRNAYPDCAPEGQAYHDPPWSNPEWKKTVPAVTLRAPTGAGKTLLTAAFIGAAASEDPSGLPSARMAVIAVPSKELIRQTALGYRDGYPRRVLEYFVGSNIMVITREQAMRLRPADIENNFILLVTTFAGFRREEKDSLRVYRENGVLLPFFNDLQPEQQAGLFTPADLASWEGAEIDSSLGSEQPVPSLVNLMRLQRPIVAIDESHQSQSKLSWDMIDSFAPRLVLETTATPRPAKNGQPGANVLVHIPALKVKAEKMLRMPIELFPSDGWQDCLNDSKKRRDRLEKLAKKEGAPIRPIVLVQAERADHQQSAIDDGKVSVFDAVNFLEQELKIPRKQIAVRTGKKDDLLNVQLMDLDCPVRYVVTVKAAAEGWDCPFAYVLAALSVGNSKIGVEQVIGRILRQYGGTEKEHRELNGAYIYAGTQSFDKTAQEVVGALESHGYSKEDLQIHSSSGSSSPSLGADQAALRSKFAKLQKPLLALKQGKNSAILAGSTQLLEEAERSKKSISLAAIDNKLQQPQSADEVISVDIDEDSGQRVEQRRKLTRREISAQYSEFTLEQIKNSLKRKIKVPGVKHDQVKEIVDRTINENFSDWSASQLHMKLPEIRQMIIAGIRQRVAELTEEIFRDSISKNKLVPASLPFPEHIYQQEHSGAVEKSKHLYETVAVMNQEEVRVAEILERSPEIKCWFRVPESDKGGYYLPGFYGNHYPDFLAISNDDKFYIIEYKGEQLLGSEDTAAKERIGGLFTKAYGAGQAEYFMVSPGADSKQSESITPDKLEELLAA